MTTEIHSTSSGQAQAAERPTDPVLEQARKAKLRHAFWLAGQVAAACRRKPGLEQLLYNILEEEVKALTRKGLVHELAVRLAGLPTRESLTDYSAIELGKYCTEVRSFLKDAGWELPRRRSGSEQSFAELVQVVCHYAGRAMQELGWSERHFHHVFVPHQLGGRREIRTVEDAKAVLGGLKGALRHSSKKERE